MSHRGMDQVANFDRRDPGGRRWHRGGRRQNVLAGATVFIRLGPYKGCRARVIEVKDTSVVVELKSVMKVVTVDCDCISDNEAVKPYRMGSVTPIHHSQTPLHPYMTPKRVPGASPIHDGTRISRHYPAWNPYKPMNPPRDNLEDGNPLSWGSSPQYQPGSLLSQPHETSTPGAGWANTPCGNDSEAGKWHDSLAYAGGCRRHDRGKNGLAGATVSIRLGAYKGYRARVIEVKGMSALVELVSKMRVVTVDLDTISDNVAITPYGKKSRYGMGRVTLRHPSRAPFLPYMTPSQASPMHNGERTSMQNPAWNPYMPVSPPRNNSEDGNPGSWGSSPRYQPGSSPSQPHETLTPVAGWASTPSVNDSEAGTSGGGSVSGANASTPYLPSTPGGQSMMPNSASYPPGTPGGQLMTPGTGGLDIISQVLDGNSEMPLFMPEILVNVQRCGEELVVGVIREVLLDGSCKVVLGSSGNGETITALPTEIEAVVPVRSDKIKIMEGALRGVTGKLIGVDGDVGIVKIDDSLDVKNLDLVVLAKLAQA